MTARMGTDPHATGPEPQRSAPAPAGTVYGRGGAPTSDRDFGLLERLHPAVTAGIAAAVIGVFTLGYLAWRAVSGTESPAGEPPAAAAPRTVEEPARSPSPSPSPTGARLSAGAWSLESADRSGSYVRRDDALAVIGTLNAEDDEADRREASFVVLAGLADPSCFSFRAADGRFLRHYDFRLKFDETEDKALFREDATFCAAAGATADSVTLRSHNYPDRVIHHRQSELWLDRPDGSEGFAAASSFVVRSPLTPSG
ncbi:AbfB domain-containing protein [Micromonospora sp. CPCC 205371]|nr:AbfB domain-containing protein [Micromonospora sp. CPCC 205371]